MNQPAEAFSPAAAGVSTPLGPLRAVGGPAAGAPEEPRRPAAESPPDVVAAGTICWRRSREPGGLEVLLVHRPRYDDWSWPKGKPEHGEPLTECAVRETAEETGVVAVLGRPLGTVRYRLPDGRSKESTFWAARAADRGPRTAPDDEVDGAAWLPLEAAARRLTYAADAEPLAALRRFATENELRTTPVLVIRHATARPRDAWTRRDALRPLVASGRRQAMALAALLRCWRPDPLLSSPWTRCLDTLAPYAAASGVRVRSKDGLSETGHRRRPVKARKHLRTLLESTHGGGLCTHRPVLGALLAELRAHCTTEAADALPRSNPFLRPGEVLVAHVARRPGQAPVVVAVERHGAG